VRTLLYFLIGSSLYVIAGTIFSLFFSYPVFLIWWLETSVAFGVPLFILFSYLNFYLLVSGNGGKPAPTPIDLGRSVVEGPPKEEGGDGE
jgi:hypothetical protein